MPAIQTTPYDTAEAVMNRARTFGNDTSLSIAGELLADAQPYVPDLLNAAYLKLQRDLTVAGVETFCKTGYMNQIPVVATPDPGVQVTISYTGTNNGTTNSALPTLPADMRAPLRLWERPTGQVSDFIPMTKRLDGLPSRPQSNMFYWWEWSGDTIVLIGALQQNDIKIRYYPKLPALVLTPQPSSVLILDSIDALAWKIVELFCQGRGGEGESYSSTHYQEELNVMKGLTAQQKQRAVARRRGWGSRRGIRRGC